MAKFYGIIGFAEQQETSPGVWENVITERNYYGDLVRNSRRLISSDKVNDDITISNEFSILSDPFANQNFHSMQYIEYIGTKWKITEVRVEYPRLILTVGGKYNEKSS
jgi:hypothetical protein|nr:MAG TPA: hypothetical protein [Bacteriophage sp.]